ncbi:semaphorin-5A [Platysternon megacephalum]|uniref:Semaphorin-5A n=1 Tax=Platysternon megacephalum TaxID=55544 RepID=A0A4D9E4V2_9SAUR|nr:semaphorin-5A [Platysternon megacephalum]
MWTRSWNPLLGKDRLPFFQACMHLHNQEIPWSSLSVFHLLLQETAELQGEHIGILSPYLVPEACFPPFTG